MRLVEIKLPVTPTYPEIKSFVEQNCKQYISQHPNWEKEPIYRGIKTSAWAQMYFLADYPKDRKPKDTDPMIHDIWVETFRKNGFKANRDNSIFCSGNKGFAVNYGTLFVIFPIDEFYFTWSPKIMDMHESDLNIPTNHIKFAKSKQYISEKIPKIYTDKNLPEAIDYGYELMITGKKYLAVRYHYMKMQYVHKNGKEQ